jgi:hypothetical protein
MAIKYVKKSPKKNKKIILFPKNRRRRSNMGKNRQNDFKNIFLFKNVTKIKKINQKNNINTKKRENIYFY